MSEKRRKELVELAGEYYIPIIDDNPYGELRYKGKDLPSLRELGGERVIELGTFSKLISPGLRIGWIVIPAEIIGVFERMKQSADLHTNTFAQYVIYEYVKNGNLDRHIEILKREYSQRRDAMISFLKKYLPKSVRWTEPEGGLFLWVILPENVSATALLEKAVENKVAYVPGKPFFAREDRDNVLRLNFSNASVEKIEEGIKRLAEVFGKYVKP
jgi:2-aminoadipate transaminase